MSSPNVPRSGPVPRADGFTIRLAEPADYAAFERLFPELATGDATVELEKFVRDLVPTTLVAVAGRPSEPGGVVGYAYFQLIKDVACVRHLVTAPEARRAGVGRALLTAVVERARAAACACFCLNVATRNAPAIALYESMGLRRAFASTALELAWSTVAGALAPRAPVTAREITPAEDADVERATRLTTGQLELARRMGHRVLMGLFERDGATGADRVVGAAVFDPAFPGAYPFRAARPELAFVLLAALRPHARPTDRAVSLFVEDQPDVADALVASGARVKLETVHMRGPLPPPRAAPDARG